MEKFIDHLFEDKVDLGFWYLTDYGKLQLHKINFSSPRNNLYHYEKEYSGNYYTREKLTEELLELLQSYDINWELLINYQQPIFLSYTYKSKGEEVDLRPDYVVPFQITSFTSGIDAEKKAILNEELHQKYLEKFDEYCQIRQSIIENLKTFNPERASKITFSTDKPEKISYVY